MGKIDEQISYNWLFFLLAGAFGAVTFWAVYDETATRREYKNHQEAFFQIEIDLADKGLKAATQKRDADPEYAKLIAEKKQLQAELAGGQRGAFEEAKKQLQEAEFEAFDKQQDYTFTKSLLDEEYYYFTKAKHEAPDSEEFKAREAKLKGYEEQLRGAEAARDQAAQARDVAKGKVEGFTARIAEVDKLLEKLDAPVGEAERRYAAAVQKQAGLFGPDTEIIQQNLEAIGRVDRCESCHVGSNRGGFESVQPAYFQSHPNRRTLFALHPVEKVGCTSCHDGQGRATTKFYAHAPSADHHDFEKHFWEEPLLKGAFMESNCRKCHTEQYELRSHLRCEINEECPQSPSKLKCEVPALPLNPSDTSIATLAPEPAVEGAPAPAVEPAKYCVNEEGRAELVDLAPHLTRGRRIIEEVACFGCHPIEGYEGRPKAAPDLRHASSKLNPGWIVEWVKNPKAFHPQTRMPNFFPEELNPEQHPKSALPVREDRSKNPGEPWKWTVDQQAQALTAFLMAQSSPFELPTGRIEGDAARGKELALNLGCRGCHNLTEDEKDPSHIKHKNRASHYDHGPNLVNVGSKTSVEWLYAWLKDPKAYAPKTRMPNLRLSDQEAADVAVYLAGNKDKRDFPAVPAANPEDKELVASGKKLLNYYGCYGCHYVTGFEETAGIGAELTEFGLKEVSRLDYGDFIVNHKQQTWESWLEAKLKHPRVYRYERVDTRMPQFDLTAEEITDVMVVLKGMRGKRPEALVHSHKLTAMQVEREKGRELMRWYNCYGCHTVDGHTGDIRQAKEYAGDRSTFAPPIIEGEGAKTQPGWLFSFFKNVKPLRPWLNVRMPTFGFEDEQATTLVAMFSALDHADYPYRHYEVPLEGGRVQIGKALLDNLRCLSCHLAGDQKLSPEDAAKAAPNLLMARERLRPEWIAKWLSNPEAMQPGTRMPSFFAGGGNLLKGLLMTPDGKKAFGDLPGIEKVSDSAIHQMELLRDVVFNLGQTGNAQSQGAAKPAKKKAQSPGAAPRKKAALPGPRRAALH